MTSALRPSAARNAERKTRQPSRRGSHDTRGTAHYPAPMSASRYCFALALLVVFSLRPFARAEDAPIRLNTLGYLPDAPKRASVASPCTTFRVVRDADGIEVFS